MITSGYLTDINDAKTMKNTIVPKFEFAAFSLLFLLYGFLCLHFYVERSTMTDYSFQLFKMIQTENFNIEHLRYGSVTTQWMVIPLIKMGVSLKTLLVAYSINIYLQYIIAFLIIRYYFSNQLIAWSLIAYCMATIHFGFFYMGCELVFGAVWICTLIALLSRIESNAEVKKSDYYLLIFNLLLLLTTHAFLLVISGLLITFLALFQFSKTKLMVVGTLGALFLIKLQFFTDGYESGKFSGTTKDIFLPHAINASYFTYFFKQQWNHVFKWVKFLWIAIAVLLLIKRRWVFVLTAIVALFGLYLVIYSFMPNGESVAYMDSYQSVIYLLGWLIAAIAFYRYLPALSNYFIGAVFIVSLIGLLNIYHEKQYTDRVEYYRQVMKDAEQKGCNKIFAQDNEVDMQKVLLTWATPYETLMLSTLNGKSQTMYINNDKEVRLDKYNTPEKFLGAVWLLDESPDLNKKYFNIEKKKYCLWRDIYQN